LLGEREAGELQMLRRKRRRRRRRRRGALKNCDRIY